MKTNDILDCLNDVDADLIEAADRVPTGKRQVSAVRRLAVAAACLAILIGSGIGIHIYAEEQREYQAAVNFFAENELSVEGLTRKEIKAVYIDITKKQFTYSKTGEVIQNSLVSKVPGYKISQNAPTPEEIENLWNYQNGYHNFLISNQNKYTVGTVTVPNPDTGLRDVTSVITKYENGTCVWQTEIESIVVLDYQQLSDGLMVWGGENTPAGTESHGKPYLQKMAKLDSNGNILWIATSGNGETQEHICAVVENSDQSLAVFSKADRKDLWISQYTADGRFLSSQKYFVGHSLIGNAIRLGEDYLVQLDMDKLVRITKDGELTDSFSFALEDSLYHIVDLQEFDGNLYISAYTTPKTEKIAYHELGCLFEDYDIGELTDMPKEDLCKVVRSKYQAVLLICDTNDGIPKQFYSVSGNLGGELEVDSNNRLIWQTEDIQSVGFSPNANSFAFFGTSERCEYTFSCGGALKSHVKTGKTVLFRK